MEKDLRSESTAMLRILEEADKHLQDSTPQGSPTDLWSMMRAQAMLQKAQLNVLLDIIDFLKCPPTVIDLPEQTGPTGPLAHEGLPKGHCGKGDMHQAHVVTGTSLGNYSCSGLAYDREPGRSEYRRLKGGDVSPQERQ